MCFRAVGQPYAIQLTIGEWSAGVLHALCADDAMPRLNIAIGSTIFIVARRACRRLILPLRHGNNARSYFIYYLHEQRAS